MKGSFSNPYHNTMRIGETLANNQSITYSQAQSPFHQKSNPYGAQIYLQSQSLSSQDSKIQHKYMLVCMELQRLTKILSKHQTMILNLTQEIQIKITDTESFRQKEQILQQQLKRIQQEDKTLLSNNHKLQQMLLQKNRLTALLEQQLVMARNKLNSHHPKQNTQDKNRIRQLQQFLIIQKNKNSDLERKNKQAVINLQRAEARMKTRQGSDKSLLINAQNRIKQLQQQLRVYVAQKRLLQQNQMRFSQQHKHLQQSKILQFSRQIQKLSGLNSDLQSQKNHVSQNIQSLQKQLSQVKNQLRTKLQTQTHNLKQITSLQNKISSLNNQLSQKQRQISLFNNQKSQMQYQIQSSQKQLKRVQDKYNSFQQQTCNTCPQLDSQNKLLLSKIKRLQQLMTTKQKQYKIVIQKSQNDIKNLKELLQSVHNLKGSNQRMSRLIEVSSSKLMRTASSKGFFSTSTLG